MTKLLIILSMLILSLSLVSISAEAKRFGGGRSVGKYRVVQHDTARKQNASPSEPGQKSNRWLGPLAGLAAGGLLASLFMGQGLGGGLLVLLVIIGLIIFIRRLFAHKNYAQARPQQYAAANSHNAGGQFFQADSRSTMPGAFAEPGFKEAFLRQAKVLFIRLQAAYDTANLSDIQEFTTPEVFAEIRLQIQERSAQENVTEVVTLNAELLEEGYGDLASVRFSGFIRETRGGPSLPFAEIWNFQQTSNSGWLVAGIQQLD
jgi:predicted lipid-binding transport protein (Tim44 family)